MIGMEVHVALKVFLSLASVVVLGVLVKMYDALVLKPNKLRSALAKQGISGPPPKFLLGNIMEIKRSREAVAVVEAESANTQSPVSHNCGAVLLPFFDPWRRTYGISLFLFCFYYEAML